jgi:hypothetical protein
MAWARALLCWLQGDLASAERALDESERWTAHPRVGTWRSVLDAARGQTAGLAAELAAGRVSEAARPAFTALLARLADEPQRARQLVARIARPFPAKKWDPTVAVLANWLHRAAAGAPT